jgi:3-isopropylmalate dehydrogenase
VQFKLVILPGDGVGPEVTAEAVKIMKTVGQKFGHSFDLRYGLIGGAAIDAEGTALSDDTLKVCKTCDAVLLGAKMGRPQR